MPIVSHTTELGAIQQDGGRQVVVRMLDQFGEQYTQSFYAPGGFDLDTRITQVKLDLSEQLAVAEFEALVIGADPGFTSLRA